MDRQSPGRADERGTVDARHVWTRRVVGTYIASLGPPLYLRAEAGKRSMAAPAIGNAAHFLIDLALEIPRTPYPAETGTRRVGVRSVIRWCQFPLHAFERERGFDRLLTIGRAHGCNAVEFARGSRGDVTRWRSALAGRRQVQPG